MLRRVYVFLLSIWITAVPALALAMQPPTTPQDEFVPLDSLPPSERLPAAPFLIAAYAFALLALMFYVWTLWRRLGAVERDMRALEKRRATGTGAR